MLPSEKGNKKTVPLVSFLFFAEGKGKDHPEHGGNNADGEGEKCLDRITENRGRAGGETGEPALAPAEERNENQREEKKRSRKTVICQLGDVFVVSRIKESGKL